MSQASRQMDAKTSPGAYLLEQGTLYMVVEGAHGYGLQALILVEDVRTDAHYSLTMDRVREALLVKRAPVCPDTAADLAA